MAPITLGIQIAKVELFLKTKMDRGDSPGDFACYEVSPRKGLSWLNKIPLDA